MSASFSASDEVSRGRSLPNISKMVKGDLTEVFDMGFKGESRIKSYTKVGD